MLGGTLGLAAPVHAQGIAYTLAPAVTEPRWQSDLGLTNDYLYGGRVGMDFGRFVSLRGFYLMRDEVQTRLGETELRDQFGEPFGEQHVDVRHYGADVVVAFGASALSPFLIGSGGIVTFDPETRDRARQLSLGYGGGIRFGAPAGLQLELMVQEWRFRLDRLALAPAGTPLDGVSDPTAENQRRSTLWTLGANIPFGGDRLAADQPPTLRWRRTVFPAELFAGRLDFDEALGLPRQELVGVRAGIDVGRQVGLRGHYWRGVEGGFTRTQPIQSWGGEAQFNLSAGIGAVPFLVLGAGQLDFRPGYEDLAGNERADETVLIAGGGIAFTLAERFRLTVAARDYMMSAGPDLQDLSSPDELRHSWLWSAGLRFGFGGGGDRLITRPPAPQRDTVVIVRDARAAAPDTASAATPAAPAAPAARTAAGRPAADTLPDYTGDRMLTIPVPREGELYVRYGPGERREAPIAPLAAGLREAVRDVIRDELERDMLVRGAARDTVRPATDTLGRPLQGLTPEAEERIAQRVAELLRDRERVPVLTDPARDDLLQRIDVVVADAIGRELDRRVREGTLAPPRAAADTSTAAATPRSTLGLQPREWSFHLGLGTTEATQMLLGARADLGQPWGRYPDIRLIPELTIGLFGGLTSTMLVGNLQYSLPDFGLAGGAYVPYVMGGLGLLHLSEDLGGRSGAEAVLNLGAGVSTSLATFGNFGIRPARVFLEYQGVDLFSLHRLLAGIQASF